MMLCVILLLGADVAVVELLFVFPESVFVIVELGLGAGMTTDNEFGSTIKLN